MTRDSEGNTLNKTTFMTVNITDTRSHFPTLTCPLRLSLLHPSIIHPSIRPSIIHPSTIVRPYANSNGPDCNAHTQYALHAHEQYGNSSQRTRLRDADADVDAVSFHGRSVGDHMVCEAARYAQSGSASAAPYYNTTRMPLINVRMIASAHSRIRLP